jgi:hypothetical protein
MISPPLKSRTLQITRKSSNQETVWVSLSSDNLVPGSRCMFPAERSPTRDVKPFPAPLDDGELNGPAFH